MNRAEDIANEVKRRLARITVANGFETDCGAFISNGNRYIDVSHAPCVVLVEGADHPNDQTPVSGLLVLTQDYVVATVLACDTDHPNLAAHMALRDLKRAIFTTDDGLPDTTWGRSVESVTYRGRDIQPRTDGKAFVSTIMEFSVKYAEKLYAP